jgi:hypothetical protein
MTLTEMAVVIGIVAVMVGLTLPAANVLYNSFESTSGAKSMINAALSSAKSIAIKEQRYAGIRFQKRYDPAGVLNASQYMIFIIHDFNQTTLANGFRAVDGIQPIKLPDSIGVMDLLYDPGLVVGNNPDVNFSNINVLRDTTTFSIVFSPSGKLVIHRVRARNRDGHPRGWPIVDNSYDDVFNTQTWIADRAMFLQDDYANMGLWEEYSRNSFYIYETKKFKQAYKSGVPYSGYLNQLKAVYVNPYMGTIVGQ